MSTTTQDTTTILPPVLQLELTSELKKIFASFGFAQSFQDIAQNDPHPLPTIAHREWYNYNCDARYWMNGLRDAKRMISQLSLHMSFDRPTTRVLDFGSASGRVIRHLACQPSLIPNTSLELYATDANPAHTDWICEYLPSCITALPCGHEPPLPGALPKLDLIYAFSVMTHIPEHEMVWLEAFHDALLPRAIVYLTFHSERTWSDTSSNKAFHEMMLRMRLDGDGPLVDLEMLRKPLPSDKVVCWDAAQGTKHLPNVFHSTEHVRAHWTEHFDVLEFISAGYNHQDVVILQAK